MAFGSPVGVPVSLLVIHGAIKDDRSVARSSVSADKFSPWLDFRFSPRGMPADSTGALDREGMFGPFRRRTAEDDAAMAGGGVYIEGKKRWQTAIARRANVRAD